MPHQLMPSLPRRIVTMTSLMTKSVVGCLVICLITLHPAITAGESRISSNRFDVLPLSPTSPELYSQGTEVNRLGSRGTAGHPRYSLEKIVTSANLLQPSFGSNETGKTRLTHDPAVEAKSRQ